MAEFITPMVVFVLTSHSPRGVYFPSYGYDPGYGYYHIYTVIMTYAVKRCRSASRYVLVTSQYICVCVFVYLVLFFHYRWVGAFCYVFLAFFFFDVFASLNVIFNYY